jgi:hypothetical protein
LRDPRITSNVPQGIEVLKRLIASLRVPSSKSLNMMPLNNVSGRRFLD